MVNVYVIAALLLTVVNLSAAGGDFDPSPDCHSDKDAGMCRGSFERWYYKTETNECETFTYGGCPVRGNGNNYPTEESCQYECHRCGPQNPAQPPYSQ